jgi:glucokinase
MNQVMQPLGPTSSRAHSTSSLANRIRPSSRRPAEVDDTRSQRLGFLIGASPPALKGCDMLARDPLKCSGNKRISIPTWLGIDIGGTKVALALGDEQGALLAQRRLPSRPSERPERDLAELAAQARALCAEAGVAVSTLRGVGVSVPGPLDPESGLLIAPPNLPGWKRVPVARLLGEALGLPVAVENDANAAALAEWRFGAGRGHQHVVFLTMSTGIGGGLVLGGRLHAGHHGGAGEVGHAPVEWDGEPCACGGRGCLEAYVGGAAWTRRLARITPATSRVATLAGTPERARPEHVVAAAREGDAFALAELRRYNDYLARGLVALVFVLAPEVVILGTIPTAAGEALCLAPVREQVLARVWPLLGRGLAIVPSGLGERLPYYAGLCVALEAAPRAGA